ncbi:unnamed protein product [Echinostoma caproni]|uniref:Uncharacterized protein n=1 Tax=Echinostoma caproni TaxID=27848 RepID=A0A3P8H1W4_9TREM|nr:unnamed protein product [Echinostoma caproni]
MESTGSSMEPTLTEDQPGSPSRGVELGNDVSRSRSDVDPPTSRSQWVTPGQTIVQKLSEVPITSGTEFTRIRAGGIAFDALINGEERMITAPPKRAWQAFVPCDSQETKAFQPISVDLVTNQSDQGATNSSPTPGPTGPGGPNVTLPSACIPDESTSPKYFGSFGSQTRCESSKLIRMGTYRLEQPRTTGAPDITTTRGLFEKVDFIETTNLKKPTGEETLMERITEISDTLNRVSLEKIDHSLQHSKVSRFIRLQYQVNFSFPPCNPH